LEIPDFQGFFNYQGSINLLSQIVL